MTSNQITIALTKGRIEKDTVKLLEKAGFDMSFMADKGRNLIFESPDKRFRFPPGQSTRCDHLCPTWCRRYWDCWEGCFG